MWGKFIYTLSFSLLSSHCHQYCKSSSPKFTCISWTESWQTNECEWLKCSGDSVQGCQTGTFQDGYITINEEKKKVCISQKPANCLYFSITWEEKRAHKSVSFSWKFYLTFCISVFWVFFFSQKLKLSGQQFKEFLANLPRFTVPGEDFSTTFVTIWQHLSLLHF